MNQAARPDWRAAWRFCLVEPGGSESERGFASLGALVAYLWQELAAG